MDSTPPTEVRMLSRFEACLVCRRRKLRCDATQPECDRCRATGSICQYQDPAYRSRTRVLQEQIKELEAKIQQIELQRGGPRGSSRASGSPSHSGSNIGSSVTSPQSVPQTASPASTSDGPVHQAATISSHLVPSVSPEMNRLSRRGPSAISLPGETSRKLLSAFMERKHVIGFELHTGRVVRSFQPASCEPAVPALYYAMLLMGCHFVAATELKFWENMIYERTKLELETNIARAYLNDRGKYNPLHHLQAMIMLGQWYYFKNRLLEGHVYITRATRFAVALGLHALDSRIYGHYVVMRQEPSSGGIERWRPRDPVELGEAINVGWACFTRDFAGTLLNGLPPSISLEEIKTVWPVSLSDFEDMNGSELSNDNYSIASLLDPKHLNVVADVSHDTANCVVSKCFVLTHCAGMLDTERISNSDVTDEWLARFEGCDRATRTFTQSVQRAYVGREIEEAANIALAQTSVGCATLQLHAPLAEYELDIGAQGDPRGRLSDSSLGGYNYMRCMEASRSIVLAAAYMEGVDVSYMHMFFGISWACAASVLAKQLSRLRQSGYEEQAREIERHLAIMAKSMERLLLAYPVLSE
ncbi:unnamed protein product [Rhizoctonia solani]|uniref:Zn(2)-C6 fungal-type domain-containing protein n=1 Tax=Rhizoctonia solani TaxID=456999 RepID=A0A8H2WZE8_9AGAM|nr:unnamed protein product [Rhizoctonia solani]CAE6520038.1 unnamed protein product [Rhizoctonia solani]